MRGLRFLAFFLGAIWFVPISCTSALLIGTNINAKLDERTVAAGDEVHALFSVVAEPGEGDDAFRALPLKDVPQMQESVEKLTFYLSEPNGVLSKEASTITYQVVQQSKVEQVIEVSEHKHDGDNVIFSRYKATASEVTPMFSRMYHFGYMFQAMPYAFAFSIILYFVGRVLRRRFSGSA